MGKLSNTVNRWTPSARLSSGLPSVPSRRMSTEASRSRGLGYRALLLEQHLPEPVLTDFATIGLDGSPADAGHPLAVSVRTTNPCAGTTQSGHEPFNPVCVVPFARRRRRQGEPHRCLPRLPLCVVTQGSSRQHFSLFQGSPLVVCFHSREGPFG